MPVCACVCTPGSSQPLLSLSSEFMSLCFYFFNFFKIFIFPIIVALECSVNFCCTAKWPTQSYTYILFFTLPSIMFYHKWLDVVACATQQDRIAYPLQMQEFAPINPRLPVHLFAFIPSPPSVSNALLYAQVLELSMFCERALVLFLRIPWAHLWSLWLRKQSKMGSLCKSFRWQFSWEHLI